MSELDVSRAPVSPSSHGEAKGHLHDHMHHGHSHHPGVVPTRALLGVSLLALSSGQRLLLTIPAIALLWALALWAMGSP